MLGQRPVDLLVELAGLGARDGEADQPDRSLGQLGQRGGDQDAGGLGGPLDAEPDGAGVAQDGEDERLAAAAGP